MVERMSKQNQNFGIIGGFILLWAIMCLTIFFAVQILNYCDKGTLKIEEPKCIEQCQDLGLGFYKVDMRSSFAGGDYCMCLTKEGLPIDIGKVEN